MFQNKKVFGLFIGSAILLFATSCGSTRVPESKGGYYQGGIYFGKNFSDYFKVGILDGCKTAKGDYTKSHTLFNDKIDYKDGWFLGRSRCKHLLVIDAEMEENSSEWNL